MGHRLTDSGSQPDKRNKHNEPNKLLPAFFVNGGSLTYPIVFAK